MNSIFLINTSMALDLIIWLQVIFYSQKDNHSNDQDHPSLNLCFTSLGFHPKKGFDNYLSLAQFFLDHYRSLNITFHVIGLHGFENTYPKPNLIYHKIMPPDELFSFYLKEI